ncbi:MAG: hypothetical protein WED15_00600, partial [Akkermansiaceae bacterium]
MNINKPSHRHAWVNRTVSNKTNKSGGINSGPRNDNNGSNSLNNNGNSLNNSLSRNKHRDNRVPSNSRSSNVP